MRLRFPLLLTFVSFAASLTARAALYTVPAAADTFVKEQTPDGTFGRAGQVMVSGPTAVNAMNVMNGPADAFLRFATSATKTQLDADFGAGQWRITAASLVLIEVTNPNNPIFNIGPGQFQVQWLNGDGWLEGIGTPNSPGNIGITWNTRAAFLNPALDRPLGVFANPVLSAAVTCDLTMDAAFLTDLTGDDETSFYLTAVSGTTGFNFRSRDFTGDPTSLPKLILDVEAIPEPASAALWTFAIPFIWRRRHSC